jgi:tetratricopeptide (TPR) repeat protein
MAEKSLTELPRELRLLYTKGNDALARENFDYAIDLFNQVLLKEPAQWEVRRALRSAQLRKAGKGGGIFKKLMSSAGSSPHVAKAQMALRKDPVEAMRIAEQVLNGDPHNSSAHRLIVEAAMALEMSNTAVLSLEVLSADSPKDTDIAIKFANSLAEIGESVRAERLLAELYRQYPTDNELGQALKNISARKTLDKGGYESLAEGKGSYRDILKDKDEAVLLEQQNRQVKSEDTAERLIREYEARLKNEPNNLKLLRDLAELYTQKKQFDTALGYYEKIKVSDAGADSALDRGIAETTIRKYDHLISQLDKTAPEYPEQVAKLQTEKQDYQLAECQKRAERFPTDLQIRFELGQLLFNAGKIGEAMKEFQKARGNPHRRIQAMSYLGQCFAKRGINDLAISTFQDAIKEKPVFDEEKKELIYFLGLALEKMGKKEDAIEQFKVIYKEDMDYRDVAKKVDDFYAGQG